MLDAATVQIPLAIDRVERSRARDDQVRLRLSGRWLDPEGAPETEALLVVQLHGRRHRFPASRERTTGSEPGPEFAASFTVPDWAVPEQSGQAVLWVGNAVVPVPPPGTNADPQLAEPQITASRRAAEVVERPAPVAPPRPPFPAAPERSVVPSAGAGGPEDPGPSAAWGSGRAGPLADLLFKETVSALHAELEQRATEVVRLRTALAEARTELESRAGSRAELESAHAELREELQRLMAAVADQRGEFDARLAALRTERDGAREELEALEARAAEERSRSEVELGDARAELEGTRTELERRLGDARSEAEAELTAARAAATADAAAARAEFDRELEAARGELDRQLAEARAELDRQLAEVRAQAESETAATRAEADAAVASARAETEAETARARAESETMLDAARADSETRVRAAEVRAQAAETRARELAERVSSLTTAERRRSDEAAALREQLAAAQVTREAALGEAGGLRDELERLGSELATVREQQEAPGRGLDDARRLLADARALTEQLRGESRL